jgi:hypothetical protein
VWEGGGGGLPGLARINKGVYSNCFTLEYHCGQGKNHFNTNAFEPWGLTDNNGGKIKTIVLLRQLWMMKSFFSDGLGGSKFEKCTLLPDIAVFW